MLIDPLSKIAEEVRRLSRKPDRLQDLFGESVTSARADTTDPESLQAALEGCDVTFYLVHSLGDQNNFYQIDMRSAKVVADAAKSVGVKRIIYLGALAQSAPNHTSTHIESRHRVGETLKSTGVSVTEFRTSVIIGSGSMPFEAIRALVERLPIMVTPRWVRIQVQPIAASDRTVAGGMSTASPRSPHMKRR